MLKFSSQNKGSASGWAFILPENKIKETDIPSPIGSAERIGLICWTKC